MVASIASPLLGAILVAFGILVIWFLGTQSLAKEWKGWGLFVTLVFGLISIGTGGWLLFSSVSFEVLKMKAVGLVLALFGFWLIFYFPDVTGYPQPPMPMRYQPAGMTRFAIFLGLILMIIGGWLMFFY